MLLGVVFVGVFSQIFHMRDEFNDVSENMGVFRNLYSPYGLCNTYIPLA